MSKKSKIFLCIGLSFVVLSIALFVGYEFSTKSELEKGQKIVAEIEKAFPQRQSGVLGEYSSTQMPVLEIYDKDVIALVEIPKYRVALPVESEWHSSIFANLPMRISGSVYDGTFTVRGMDSKGQFDCASDLQIGDEIKVIDMTGAEFKFAVHEMLRKSANETDTLEKDSDFTLIIKEQYSFDCIVVVCKQK